jgi:uncharacterized protein DUF3467
MAAYGLEEPFPESRYVNAVNIFVSIFDFEIEFLKNVPVKDDESGEVSLQSHETGRVTMSPQHAKALAAVLTQHVAQYEENYGAVPDQGDQRG